MNRHEAETIVARALDVGREELGVDLRTLLVVRDIPARHAGLFQLLGYVRRELGRGGITVEMAESMTTGHDIVDYVVGLPDAE